MQRPGFLLTDKDIYRTTNEGVTWSKAGPGWYANLFFLNAQYGYAHGQSDFAYTTDGGASWVRRHLFSPTGYDVFFTTPSTGIITSANGLFKTSDTRKTGTKGRDGATTGICFTSASNGNTWSRSARVNSANLVEVFFIDANNAGASAHDNLLLQWKP